MVHNAVNPWNEED